MSTHQLIEAIRPLARIADAYDDNGLDDEARKVWGKNDEYVNETPHDQIELYSGRGGRQLLTLADCMLARKALQQIESSGPSPDEIRFMLQHEPFSLMVKALHAQEVGSQMQREDMPEPNDPRYTPYIGEWNGYHAPEQRYGMFMHERRDLRVLALRQVANLLLDTPAEETVS